MSLVTLVKFQTFGITEAQMDVDDIQLPGGAAMLASC